MTNDDAPAGRWGGPRDWFCFLFGVVTPVLALWVELASGTWGQEFFDPLPTPAHVAAVALVPLVVVSLMLRGAPRTGNARRWGFAWGAALGVALTFSVPFALFVPLSLFTILIAGVGFLPLAPLTSFVALLLVRPACVRRDGGPAQRAAGRWLAVVGFVAALAALSAADLPRAAASHLVRDVVLAERAGDDSGRAAALDSLRRWVPDASIHAAVDRRQGMLSPLAAFVRVTDDTTADARRYAAWLATATVPDDPFGRGRGSFDDDSDDGLTRADRRRGGRFVGPPQDGLCMESSHVEGVVRADAAVADLTWTVNFRNRGTWEAESRMLVDLPAGAVVSDATLWVEGKPRDAVFAATAKAREAYENIVKVQRRDPLLVTQPAAGTVFVQCFPVRESGGTMQIRLRLAVPLEADGGHRLVLALPSIQLRNFGMCEGGSASGVLHVVGDVMAAPPEVGRDAAGRTDPTLTWSGAGRDDLGVTGTFTFHTALGGGSPTVVAADPLDQGADIVRTWGPSTQAPPADVVMVVDVTRATERGWAEVSSQLLLLPAAARIQAFAASDRVVRLTDGPRPRDEAIRAIVSGVAALPRPPAVDAEFALREADRAAAATPGALRLWLHGPQALARPLPDDVETTPAIAAGAPFVAVALADGENALLAEERVAAVRVAGGDAAVRWRVAERRVLAPGRSPRASWIAGTGPAGTVRIDDERATRALAALWARDTAADLAGRSPASIDVAVRVAASHRIVSEWTAAVVLETDEDYRKAGLVAPPGTIPSVPEPGLLAVIGVVACVVLFESLRRRRQAA